MKKKPELDDMIETTGSMNKTAIFDAMLLMGYEEDDIIPENDQRRIRQKREKMIKSTKKYNRKISYHLNKNIDRIL